MTQGGYRTHCKNAHFMIFSHCSILNSNATIEANHSEFCCTQCERFYSCKSSFRKHLTRAHDI
ncbi:hypothetical protein HMPREF1544_07604 [Mucor circinelloides 1006PhL]|uniref:C2H2-type domain-containing protein n=1 Tax=Mucor circinelloides f. circinelloides (strain 1006PhL) TaxID=1220926 RepID=S2J653_MUCC1|nr:hypothetical protein HMPREF1544_07604 [Mucor circinelloides 1006PhL]